MNKDTQTLVVEIVGLLGKALDTGPASRLSPNEKARLNETVEKLIAHDSDELVKQILHALIGSDLNTGLADKLRQKY